MEQGKDALAGLLGDLVDPWADTKLSQPRRPDHQAQDQSLDQDQDQDQDQSRAQAQAQDQSQDQSQTHDDDLLLVDFTTPTTTAPIPTSSLSSSAAEPTATTTTAPSNITSFAAISLGNEVGVAATKNADVDEHLLEISTTPVVPVAVSSTRSSMFIVAPSSASLIDMSVVANHTDTQELDEDLPISVVEVDAQKAAKMQELQSPIFTATSSSTPSTTTTSVIPNTTSSLIISSDTDTTAIISNTTTTTIPTTTITTTTFTSTTDDFGEFSGFAETTPREEVMPISVMLATKTAPTAINIDFGEFGDFANTTSGEAIIPLSVASSTKPSGSEPTPISTTCSDAVTADDDFDDFGEFGGQGEGDENKRVLFGGGDSGSSDATEEARVAKMLDSIRSEMKSSAESSWLQFNTALKNAFPLAAIASIDAGDCAKLGVSSLLQGDQDDSNETSTGDVAASSLSGVAASVRGPKGKLTVPNSKFSEDEWYGLWKRLSSDQSYSENILSKFRWKKALVRKLYLKALDVNISLDEPSQSSSDAQPVATAVGAVEAKKRDAAVQIVVNRATGEIAGDAKDVRQAEIDEAKLACSMLEDELRQKSNDELVELIKSLALHQVKMQEQANYWLDAKEQLLMDAEMHNKMIASLVQYATQQHVAGSPKGTPRGRSPNKNKKRAGAKHH